MTVASTRYVTTANDTVYERRVVCADLVTPEQRQRVDCWQIPWRNHAVTFGGATSGECVARANRLVGGGLKNVTTGIEWFGSLQPQSESSVDPTGLHRWLVVVAVTGVASSACEVLWWKDAASFVVRCQGRWVVSWEAPEPHVWLWTTVMMRGRELCIVMRQDRQGLVVLEQCVSVSLDDAQLQSVVFVGNSVETRVLSWMGQPVMDTLFSSRKWFWYDELRCRESILAGQQWSHGVTRYVDEQWIVNGDTGHFVFRIPVQELLVAGLHNARLHCVVGGSCGNVTDTCAIEWVDARGVMIHSHPFSRLVTPDQQ